MKNIPFKVILFTCFLSTCTSVFSQENFPEDSVHKLIGRELKVKSLDKTMQTYGYEGFYLSNNLKNIYSCCTGRNSKYESLVEKIFRVISFEAYENSIGSKKYKLKLTNSEIGDIYFDYDPKYEFKFPFEVIGGLSVSDNFYCIKIDSTYDKFTNSTTYITPVQDGFKFYKIKDNKGESFFLTKNEPGASLTFGSKGFILLLENGKRIDKPDADIKVNSNGYGGYYCSVRIELNQLDVKLLSVNAITDSRLYIYDSVVKSGKKIIKYFNCLVNK